MAMGTTAGRWRPLASAAVAAVVLFALTDSVAFASALAASPFVASVDAERVPVPVARGAFGVTLVVLAVLGWDGPMAGVLAGALAVAGAWCCVDAVHVSSAALGDDGRALGRRPTGATGWRAVAALGERAGGRLVRPLRPSRW
jgi:hypothetical protein